MNKAFSLLITLFIIGGVVSAEIVQGMDFEFLPIGNAGNSDSTYGVGGVDYNYRIGKYEITAGQYTTFLNEMATSDSYSLYPGGSQINQSGSSGNYSYSTSIEQTNKPLHSVIWVDAARFCNFLTTGDTETGVYEFSSKYDFTVNVALKNGTTQAYWVPTEDEWYKAAYYTGSGYALYANGSNTKPSADNGWNYQGGAYNTPWDVGTGTEEQNGTFDMMGNVNEFVGIPNAFARYRGGSYGDSNIGGNSYGGLLDSVGSLHLGFRVASNVVPEPATLLLVGIGALMMRRRK